MSQGEVGLKRAVAVLVVGHPPGEARQPESFWSRLAPPPAPHKVTWLCPSLRRSAWLRYASYCSPANSEASWEGTCEPGVTKADTQSFPSTIFKRLVLPPLSENY